MGEKNLAARLKRLEKNSSGVSERAYATRLRALAAALVAARDAPSPALALHRNGARAGLFQLEALARAHRKVVDERALAPLHAAFKLLEDGLGAVDFHDAILRKFGDKGDAGSRAFVLGRRAEACAHLEHRMRAEAYLAFEGAEPPALGGLLDVIEAVRWPGDKRERRAFGEYYAAESRELQRRLKDGEYDYTDLEGGVHEVRRRARWLSILPAALDGLFVRPDEAPTSGPLAFYATPEVLASPFNSFPPRKEVGDPMILAPGPFLALSWLIAVVGTWKDRGQWREALEAARLALGDDERAAATHVRAVLGEDFVEPAAITRAVRDATKRVVRDKVFARLAEGVGA